MEVEVGSNRAEKKVFLFQLGAYVKLESVVEKSLNWKDFSFPFLAFSIVSFQFLYRKC